ncbi:MAG: diacylglycerol kinase family lipid kinase [Bacteroidales bacterium]|nr:diacylglycerol kinase family lipid kinase [Bacteroidales bacterium]
MQNNIAIRQDYLAVVNPNAGKGKGLKDWKEIAAYFSKYNIIFEARFTLAARHAIELTVAAIQEGYRKIIVVGGDGTMNEVVNGIFLQRICPTTDIELAMITVGTGNDWGRMFGIPTDYEKAIQVILEHKMHLQDAGMIYYFNGTEKEKRFFINIAGLGFDAVVAKRTNLQKAKGRSGRALYMMNLLRSLILYRSTNTEVEIDNLKIKNNTFTISIGIGKYSGGGMMQTPEALPDDGLFDITVVKKIGKGDLLLNLKKLYNGSILEHPKIEGYKGKRIVIDSDPLIHIEADGESLGHSPIEFQIIPKAVYILYGTYPLSG